MLVRLSNVIYCASLLIAAIIIAQGLIAPWEQYQTRQQATHGPWEEYQRRNAVATKTTLTPEQIEDMRAISGLAAMNVEMQDGTIIENVPEGITQNELSRRYKLTQQNGGTRTPPPQSSSKEGVINNAWMDLQKYNWTASMNCFAISIIVVLLGWSIRYVLSGQKGIKP